MKLAVIAMGIALAAGTPALADSWGGRGHTSWSRSQRGFGSHHGWNRHDHRQRHHGQWGSHHRHGWHQRGWGHHPYYPRFAYRPPYRWNGCFRIY